MNDMPRITGTLHSHPAMEERLGVDEGHIVVDIKDRDKVLAENKALKAEVQSLEDHIASVCV